MAVTNLYSNLLYTVSWLWDVDDFPFKVVWRLFTSDILCLCESTFLSNFNILLSIFFIASLEIIICCHLILQNLNDYRRIYSHFYLYRYLKETCVVLFVL